MVIASGYFNPLHKGHIELPQSLKGAWGFSMCNRK